MVLRPLSHLSNPEPLGLGGLVVRLEDDPETDPVDLHCLVNVRCLRLRPLSRSSNPDRQIRQVPLCMLMPPHHWPVGAVTSVALSVPLFGLPYSDGAVALQVRNRGAISSSSGSNTAPLMDGSPYTGGDYFELTVRTPLSTLGVVRVVFICAVQDSVTKTWLVRSAFFNLKSPLIIRILDTLQNLWCLSADLSSSHYVYLGSTVSTTFSTLRALGLRYPCLYDGSPARHGVGAAQLSTHFHRLLLLTTPLCKRSLFPDLKKARIEWALLPAMVSTNDVKIIVTDCDT